MLPALRLSNRAPQLILNSIPGSSAKLGLTASAVQNTILSSIRHIPRADLPSHARPSNLAGGGGGETSRKSMPSPSDAGPLSKLSRGLLGRSGKYSEDGAGKDADKDAKDGKGGKEVKDNTSGTPRSRRGSAAGADGEEPSGAPSLMTRMGTLFMGGEGKLAKADAAPAAESVASPTAAAHGGRGAGGSPLRAAFGGGRRSSGGSGGAAPLLLLLPSTPAGEDAAGGAGGSGSSPPPRAAAGLQPATPSATTPFAHPDIDPASPASPGPGSRTGSVVAGGIRPSILKSSRLASVSAPDGSPRARASPGGGGYDDGGSPGSRAYAGGSARGGGILFSSEGAAGRGSGAGAGGGGRSLLASVHEAEREREFKAQRSRRRSFMFAGTPPTPPPPELGSGSGVAGGGGGTGAGGTDSAVGSGTAGGGRSAGGSNPALQFSRSFRHALGKLSHNGSRQVGRGRSGDVELGESHGVEVSDVVFDTTISSTIRYLKVL